MMMRLAIKNSQHSRAQWVVLNSGFSTTVLNKYSTAYSRPNLICCPCSQVLHQELPTYHHHPASSNWTWRCGNPHMHGTRTPCRCFSLCSPGKRGCSLSWCHKDVILSSCLLGCSISFSWTYARVDHHCHLVSGSGSFKMKTKKSKPKNHGMSPQHDARPICPLHGRCSWLHVRWHRTRQRYGPGFRKHNIDYTWSLGLGGGKIEYLKTTGEL